MSAWTGTCNRSAIRMRRALDAQAADDVGLDLYREENGDRFHPRVAKQASLSACRARFQP